MHSFGVAEGQTVQIRPSAAPATPSGAGVGEGNPLVISGAEILLAAPAVDPLLVEAARAEEGRTALLVLDRALHGAEGVGVLRLAERLFDAPLTSINRVDFHHLRRFRTQCPIQDSERDLLLCAHVVLHDEAILVPDGATDDRQYRSYLGTLCMLDHRPRQFSEEDLQLLADLAELASADMERALAG